MATTTTHPDAAPDEEALVATVREIVVVIVACLALGAAVGVVRGLAAGDLATTVVDGLALGATTGVILGVLAPFVLQALGIRRPG